MWENQTMSYDYELIVCLKCAGVNVRLDNLTDTVTSFIQKNKNVNYKFYVVAEEGIVNQAQTIFDTHARNRLLEIKTPSGSWATDFNLFIDKYSEAAEWLLVTHDDVKFLTDNYFHSIISALPENKNNIGWITSTSEHYYKNLGKMVTDTFRAGFYKDNYKWHDCEYNGTAMFQLHHNDFNNIDYPNAAVKIHGPMSAIMIIPMSSMKQIGHCEDWTPYTMMIDEDWSLEALKNNLYNVWVPNVYHLHPNRFEHRKALNRWVEQAHGSFLRKWGFQVGLGGEQGCSIGLAELKKRWKHTLIPWSSYRNSYDWEYLDG